MFNKLYGRIEVFALPKKAGNMEEQFMGVTMHDRMSSLLTLNLRKEKKNIVDQ